MTLLWTDPREWKTEDPITKERLNAISDDLNYLLNPSRRTITILGSGSNQTTTSATLVDLDAANYAASVELTGKRSVKVRLHGAATNNTLGAFTYFDVLIDNSIYLSNLTATPASTHARFIQTPVANYYSPIQLDVEIPIGILSAGVHTFRPQWRVSGGTATWYESAVLSQFSVGE